MQLKKITQKILVEIFRLILGVTFIFSGFVKIVDPLGTAYKIQDYITAFDADFFYPLALPIAIILCVTEFSVGMFMLFGMYRKWNSRITLLIMLFMTPLTLYLAIANPVSDCGCFGDALVITNWQTFYKNLVLLAAAIFVVIYNQKITNIFTGKFYWMVAIFVIGFGITFSIYNYYTEPVFDFRPYKIGANLPQLMNVEEGKGDVYENVFIYEKDGIKKEFAENNYPWQDSTWIFVDRVSKLVKEGLKPVIHDFSINRIYFNPEKTGVESEEDITEEVLGNEGYVFLMTAYSLNDMSDVYLSRFVDVNNYATDNHYDFYCLTASTEDEIVKWENQNSNNFKFCLTDERTLKTMMRSNPGLILLKNGVIIDKWTGSKVPSENVLTKPIELLPLGSIVDTETQNSHRLWIIILIFSIPILIIKILDFTIYRNRKAPEDEKSNK